MYLIVKIVCINIKQNRSLYLICKFTSIFYKGKKMVPKIPVKKDFYIPLQHEEPIFALPSKVKHQHLPFQNQNKKYSTLLSRDCVSFILFLSFPPYLPLHLSFFFFFLLLLLKVPMKAGRALFEEYNSTQTKNLNSVWPKCDKHIQMLVYQTFLLGPGQAHRHSCSSFWSAILIGKV